MSTLSLEEAIAIEGGALELNESFPGLPADTILQMVASLNFLANVFLHNLEDRDHGLFIAATRSSGLACRARRLSDGNFVLLVPAGFFGRLRVLCRTLLRYWDKEHHILLGNSPFDDIREDEWQVPPKLVALFDPKPTGENFWKHLKKLDDSLDLDPRFETDVLELMHLGVVFLLCHEFAHVFFRHFDFLAMAKQKNPEQADRIRRGLELQADSFAGTWATTIFLAQIGADADLDSIARGILRQSYVVTAILAIFDAQKKYVPLYDHGDYNHPLLRREIFANACRREVSLRGQEFFDFWQEVEKTGWKRAVDALAELNLEAMTGKFGRIAKGKLAYPLQSMNYGAGAFAGTLQQMLEESKLLLEDVMAQVADFNKDLWPPEVASES